jgi:formate hydrogenlyase subunit 3/multisubunit Na+/H+ antiporter MnhD subunit
MSLPPAFPAAAVMAALGLILAGAAGAGFARASRRTAAALGIGGAVAGGLVGLAGALAALPGGATDLRLAWGVPYGSFLIGVDPLSALFLVPVFLLTALAAVYSAGYWRHEPDARAADGWCFMNLLAASMVLVLVARNAVLFLAAWEAMTLTSFRLVAFDPDRPDTRRAAWIYLAASQFGAACLIAMFLRLGAGQAGLDFDGLAGFAARMPDAVPLVLALGAVGFGLKAGLMPLHGWLPVAHPAAPSHVSAVMSGVMIKTGLYGLVRLAMLSGGIPAGFGWLLLAAGLASAVLGVLRALAQRDMKRMLAYSSVENVGLIAAGLGLGFLGLAHGRPEIAFAGLAGGLLHMLNHAVFKGLLFLGAGAVAESAGTRDMDLLGGLWRRMPVNGPAFLVGAAAIAALPPLNGFAGEFLLFAAGFAGVRADGPVAAAGAATVAALALIGGLSAACFVRAFGISFLGEPRTAQARAAREVGPSMQWPVATLAGACVVAGLAAPQILRAIAAVVASIAPAAAPSAPAALGWAVAAGAAAALLAGILLLVRRALLAKRTVAAAGTWDCGYALPDARMQYTATSFAQPLLDAFAPAAAPHAPRGLFAEPVAFDAAAPAAWKRRRDDLLRAIAAHLATLRWLQHGRIHLYVLYIALALLVLLVVGLAP